MSSQIKLMESVCDQIANTVAMANMQRYFQLHICDDKKNNPALSVPLKGIQGQKEETVKDQYNYRS